MTASEMLSRFPKLRALVVGDVCLDRWCRYDPDLADESRETGIPRIAVVSTEVTPGAGGTVAANLAALGAGEVALLGVAGYDGFGYELEGSLAARGISRDLLLRANIPTFTYSKLINAQTGKEDLPRVDFVHNQPLPGDLEAQLVARIEEAAPAFDVVIVADQAETSQGGVVTPGVREALARLGNAFPQTIFWVDSRRRAEHFRRVIVKINRQEANAASLRALGKIDMVELWSRLEAPLLVITDGADGAFVLHRRGAARVRTEPVENPVDICGAGDSFSAGAALALRATGDPVVSARFGNLVASVTIMKNGTGTASPGEVVARCGRLTL